MSDWSEVRRGDAILGKDGKQWTILSRVGTVVRLSRPGADPFEGTPSGPVTIVRKAPPPKRGDSAMDLIVAQGIVATKFGGITIYKEGPDKQKPKMTPVEFLDPGSLLAHLMIFHDALCEDPSLAGLSKEHAALHGPQYKVDSFYEPHVHDPDFERL